MIRCRPTNEKGTANHELTTTTQVSRDTGPDRALEVVGSHADTPSGVTIQVYRPTGRAQ